MRRQRAEETRVHGENACRVISEPPGCYQNKLALTSKRDPAKAPARWMAANRKAYHVVDEAGWQKLPGLSTTAACVS